MKFIKNIFNKSRPVSGGIFFDELSELLGFQPVDEKNYRRAFTHRSAQKTDTDGNPLNYERLEFLGDAMLGAVIAAHLFRYAPSGNEGYLTKMRSKIVSREHLNELGRDFNLIRFIDSKVAVNQYGDNIYGNMFEALIGAIYLDKGFVFCEQFIQEKVIKPYVNISQLEGKITSYKSLIIEWCQKRKNQFQFDVFEENTAEGQKFFGVRLKINEQIIAKARATSKKKAEEKAAQRAYYALQSKIEGKG
ncbi:MAG: ribonuclease III [Flavobacterium sp. BFFFF2]|nr:MAG: ribonuclease III [Flavobacterium sp. BFFFF2]